MLVPVVVLGAIVLHLEDVAGLPSRALPLASRKDGPQGTGHGLLLKRPLSRHQHQPRSFPHLILLEVLVLVVQDAQDLLSTLSSASLRGYSNSLAPGSWQGQQVELSAAPPLLAKRRVRPSKGLQPLVVLLLCTQRHFVLRLERRSAAANHSSPSRRRCAPLPPVTSSDHRQPARSIGLMPFVASSN